MSSYTHIIKEWINDVDVIKKIHRCINDEPYIEVKEEK